MRRLRTISSGSSLDTIHRRTIIMMASSSPLWLHALARPAVTGVTINSAVSSYALTVIGAPYLFGGFSKSTGWDCSGCVNNILGIEFGLLLPEMGTTRYTGTSHGPSAKQYRQWRFAETIERSAMTAGDLVIWKTHIGIALDPTYMLSALDKHYGTTVTPIDGFGPAGETMTCRHIIAPV
jgi:cell wall-associated NlpC family hydrolase